MPKTAQEIGHLMIGEQANVAIDFRGLLDTGETLTGTPTVTEVDTTLFTLSSKAVSVGSLTINGKTVGAGLAVQFFINATAATAGGYLLRVLCGTSEGQTRGGYVRVQVAT